MRLGRITALRRQDGGVRGIVVGDVLRWLVVRTMAKLIAEEVEGHSTPTIRYEDESRKRMCRTHIVNSNGCSHICVN